MSSINIERLPEKERAIYKEITSLLLPEKKLLYLLIKRSSKDGYTVVTGKNPNLTVLINRGLIIENYVYRGYGRSFKILPHSPFLYRKLKSYKGNQ